MNQLDKIEVLLLDNQFELILFYSCFSLDLFIMILINFLLISTYFCKMLIIIIKLICQNNLGTIDLFYYEISL